MKQTLHFPEISESVVHSARKTWLASLGVVSLLGETTGKVIDQLGNAGKNLEVRTKQTFDRLVERGSSVQSRGRQNATKARAAAEETVEVIQKQVDGRLTKFSLRLGIPHRQQIRALTDRVEELTRKIESLQTQSGVEATAPAPAAPAPEVLKLVPVDAGWALVAEATGNVLSEYATKDKGLVAGREVAMSRRPSRLVIFKLDGEIQNRYSFDK